MNVYVCVGLELSDEDAALNEIARDCGHTLSHPKMKDWELTRGLPWHGETCLEFLLEVEDDTDSVLLLTELDVEISHPAVAISWVLQVSDEPFI